MRRRCYDALVAFVEKEPWEHFVGLTWRPAPCVRANDGRAVATQDRTRRARRTESQVDTHVADHVTAHVGARITVHIDSDMQRHMGHDKGGRMVARGVRPSKGGESRSRAQLRGVAAPPSRVEVAFREFARFVRRLESRAPHGVRGRIDYFVVAEQGLEGLLHLHAVLHNTRHLLVGTIRDDWKCGFANVRVFDRTSRGCTYLLKSALVRDVQFEISRPPWPTERAAREARSRGR